MTDIVSSNQKIQLESTQAKSPVSQDLLNKMGGSINYAIDTTASNASDIITNEAAASSGISTNAGNISTNTGNISTNTGNIADNLNKLNGIDDTRVLNGSNTINFATNPNYYVQSTLVNSDQPQNHFYITPKDTRGKIVVLLQAPTNAPIQWQVRRYTPTLGSWQSYVAVNTGLVNKFNVGTGIFNTAYIGGFEIDLIDVSGSLELYIASSNPSPIYCKVRWVDYLQILN